MSEEKYRTEFAGTEKEYEAEDNKPAVTAGEEPHDNPWKYADFEAPPESCTPPTNEVEVE